MKFHSAGAEEIVVSGIVLSREHRAQGRTHFRIEKDDIDCAGG